MSEFTFHTLRESITSAIREKILTGGLQPGCKLTEQKLAEEFGSSRAPIREALRQLEQEGLIEYSRNVGCSVRSTSPPQARTRSSSPLRTPTKFICCGPIWK